MKMLINFLVITSLLPASCIMPEIAYASRIPRASLLQYQYVIDVPRCNINLSNGIRVEFSGVYANEGGDTVFEEIVTFRIPTEKTFGISTMVKVMDGADSFDAKVVKLEPGFVYLAFGSEFLNEFWGSEGSFTIQNIGVGSYRASENFELPVDKLTARITISKGRTCQTEALDTD